MVIEKQELSQWMYWVKCIGYSSHSEEFHERQLLTRLKGKDAQSFISLISFYGIDFGSYKAS